MWNAVETFIYAPDEDKTFEAYYRRYEYIYVTDCADLTDAKKVRRLLRKLGTVEHNKFVDYIFPKKTCELGFLETVKLLSELFSSKTSLFHKRWKCLDLTKRYSDDYSRLASVVNKNCDDFKLGELTADNFKCLILAQGLMSAKNAEIRRRVLSKLENEPDLTLQKLAEDRQRIVSFRKDSKNIVESDVAYERKVKHRSQSYSPVKERKNPDYSKIYDYQKFQYRQTSDNQKKTPSACYRCRKLHWAKSCPYRTKKCQNCDKFGHKGSQCKNKKID